MTVRAADRLLRAATLVVAVALASQGGRAATSHRVAGNLVFWDQVRGFEAIVANADVFTEISPFWYRVEADGHVVPYQSAAGATYEDPAIVSFLRQRDIRILPTVANASNGAWDGALVSRIIADPQLASANIDNLVRLAVDKAYDGIDLDYENLAASDRAAFSVFVQDLAAALHARGKLLTVNVYGKTSEPGTWDGPRAQDWYILGQAADQVRIMTYEYHWSTSPPGPISPIDWVNDVISFARTVIPQHKVMQGVPFYGYDWVGSSGRDVVWTEAMQLVAQHGATLNWDALSASPWFEYVSGKTRHTVWFENAASVDAKLQLNVAHGIGGVTLWRLGGEDPDNWTALRARFGGTAPPPDTTPPTVALLSPLDGATVDRKQRIEAGASDDVRVARVEIFVDDTLIATDSTAPYVVWWNTRRATKGLHTIRAVAYDTSGNAAGAQVVVFKN